MNEKIVWNGKQYTKKELAEKFNVKYGTFIAKLSRGWTLEEIKNNYRQDGYGIDIDGVHYKSKKEACEKLNLSYRQLNNVINNIKTSNGVTIDGIHYKSKKEACQKLDISIYTLNKIINNKASYSDDNKLNNKKIIIDGKEFNSKKEVANFYNINYNSFLNKITMGWSIEQIIGIDQPPEKVSLSEEEINKLSKQYNIDKDILIKKIKKGYTLDKILNNSKNKNNKINCNGIDFNSIAEMCRYYNKPVKLVYNRLNIGWTLEQAVDIEERTTI